jgi:hypothetical protein
MRSTITLVIGRLGRREGVGLVQKAANGDTGHERNLSTGIKGGTLDWGLRGVQAGKQFRFAWVSRHCEHGAISSDLIPGRGKAASPE